MAKPPCNEDFTAIIAELRRENFDLKYLLYWKDRNVEKLTKAMLKSNAWLEDLQCDCRFCCMSGYWDGYACDDLSKSCRFRPWLREKIARCGMTESIPGSARKLKHCSHEESEVFDVDCHLVWVGGMSGFITYGAKIWKAELGSKELKKLDCLFELLNPCHVHDTVLMEGDADDE